ncbi:E3 ubiquitin-protein ligase SHPRH-like [Physella acuta]|uniref:E3 ubiquitin-protein ligase SHPRH-like n=1 Tax=Physella acuta TaxID=109671 RepID=UPI0027DBE23F|nr:E3 ubiquitin-protein ligase SHPRH-like [Physella acuta]
MGKRKQTLPKFADQAKRQQLEWNMLEQMNNSQTFICDQILENVNVDNAASSSSSTPQNDVSSSNHTPLHALCVDTFYQNLASCHSTLTLRKATSVKLKNNSHFLEFGQFKVTLVSHSSITPLPEVLPDFEDCWLYLSHKDTSMLYFETEKNGESIARQKRTKSRQSKFGLFWFVSLSVPVAVLTNLKHKSFLLLCDEFDSTKKEFTVSIYGSETLVLKLSHPSESLRFKIPQLAVQKLMDYYYHMCLPYAYEGVERTTGHDFFHLYECVMAVQMERLSLDPTWTVEVSQIHHGCLKPTLRQYQKQSVAWMLRQERNYTATKRQINELHPLYCAVTLKDGTALFYNRHGGSLVREKPKAIPHLPGGILADEMGLGKTVEVLCCMLLNPRPNIELPEELPTLEDSAAGSDENSLSSEAPQLELPEKLPVLKHSVTGSDDNSLSSEAPNLELPDKVLKHSITGSDDNSISSEALNLELSEKPPVLESSLLSSVENNLCSDAVEDSEEKTMNVDDAENTHDENGSCVFDSHKIKSVSVAVPSQDSNSSSDTIIFTNEESYPQTVDMVDRSACQSNVDAGVITFLNSKEIQILDDAETDIPTAFDLKSAHASNISQSINNKLVYNVSCITNQPGNDRQQEKILIKVTHSNNLHTTNGVGEVFIKNLNSNGASIEQACGSKVRRISVLDSSLLKQGLQKASVTPVLKEKKKRKGYVEYVPMSEEASYFTTKPTAQKQFFECNCGQLDDEYETRRKGLHTVKCDLCGMSQHAECMNYDLKDPHRGQYRCPHCHALHTTIESGATLIISPYSICHQWIEEISKHIKERSIRVFIYTGVAKLGYIQPQTLAQQDIVITTYDVLRKELDYVNIPHTNSESGRRFRHPKRFLATPSPLVAVEWWRICLDEAQMVECVTTKTAEMALKLKAVNRWCVTGTPLMRSVEDIYGLLLFLGVDPLMVQQWFRLLVWEPFCHGFTAPMHQALAQILWRTAKKDVIDQIDLPAQTEEINWLTFSPVEEHFYRRQYEVYLRNAYAYRNKAQHIQDPNTKLHALDRKTMSELLSPLFRLRQACCHPQIVRGEFLPLNKTMMTMEELLEHMTKKVKTECEEAHRQIVASLNGKAGLLILRGKLAEAVEKYRDVLRSVEEHKDQFRTDDLQQLHAMYNLAEILDKKPDNVAPTLRDASLRDECAALKEKYMSKTKTSFTSSKEAVDLVQRSLNELTLKLSSLDGDWWADVVDMAVHRAIEKDLICKIKDDLLRTSTTEGTIADVFTDASGLMYIIDSHLQTLHKARKSLKADLDNLANDTSHALVQTAASCCLRPVEEVLKTCPFCKVDELFNEYESRLFLFVERGITVSGDDNNLAYQVSTKRQGTWADSEVERSLKSILSFYRLQFDPDHDILEAASTQLKYLETLKKEFKNLRSLWLSHREMVSAIDECEMATERLRLRTRFEPEAATKIPNVIEERDMLQHELKCSSDEIIGREELKKKQGQLIYLKNLAKKNSNGEDCNPDNCPICQMELGVEWSVLMCGHCYCLRCIRALIDRNLIGGQILERRLKCPMCRHMTSVREISYVTTKKTVRPDVKGSHSTKVQAIIECLLKIRQEDPTAKSLVFSVWVSVLDILAAALAKNKIIYKSLHDLNYFQKNLSAFKSEESIQVLLLPLHSGANGLNLVEANHVLLVEPELNLEEEAQAISRIYRIGQTRQTKIHRFLVRGTIEEKIYHMVKTLRESKSGNEEGGETLELTVGHITSLLQQPGPNDDEDDMEDVDPVRNAQGLTQHTPPVSQSVGHLPSGQLSSASIGQPSSTSGQQTGQLSSSTSGEQTGQLSSSTSGEQTGQLSSTSGEQTGQLSSSTSGEQTGQLSSSTSGEQTGQLSSSTSGEQTGQLFSVSGEQTGQLSSSTSGEQTGQLSSASIGQLSSTSGEQTGQLSSSTSGEETGQLSSSTSGEQTGQLFSVSDEQTGQVSSSSGEQTGQLSSASASQLSSASGEQTGQLSSVSAGQLSSASIGQLSSSTSGEQTGQLFSVSGEQTGQLSSSTSGEQTGQLSSASIGQLSSTSGEQTGQLSSSTSGEETGQLSSSTSGEQTGQLSSSTSGEQTGQLSSSTSGEQTDLLSSASGEQSMTIDQG